METRFLFSAWNDAAKLGILWTSQIPTEPSERRPCRSSIFIKLSPAPKPQRRWSSLNKCEGGGASGTNLAKQSRRLFLIFFPDVDSSELYLYCISFTWRVKAIEELWVFSFVCAAAYDQSCSLKSSQENDRVLLPWYESRGGMFQVHWEWGENKREKKKKYIS